MFNVFAFVFTIISIVDVITFCIISLVLSHFIIIIIIIIIVISSNYLEFQ